MISKENYNSDDPEGTENRKLRRNKPSEFENRMSLLVGRISFWIKLTNLEEYYLFGWEVFLEDLRGWFRLSGWARSQIVRI